MLLKQFLKMILKYTNVCAWCWDVHLCEGFRSPGTGGTGGGCEHLIRVQGTNPGPLEERTALLMASPPLQLQLTHPVGISSVTSPKIYKPLGLLMF